MHISLEREPSFAANFSTQNQISMPHIYRFKHIFVCSFFQFRLVFALLMFDVNWIQWNSLGCADMPLYRSRNDVRNDDRNNNLTLGSPASTKWNKLSGVGVCVCVCECNMHAPESASNTERLAQNFHLLKSCTNTIMCHVHLRAHEISNNFSFSFIPKF